MKQRADSPLQQTPFSIADGYVIHNRKQPKAHRFKYNMTWFLLNLDQITALSQRSKWLSHNRLGVLSLYDRDYINQEKRPIKEKLIEFIAQKTTQKFDGDVYLFTHPRFLGYGFNSVNFYFCYQQGQMKFIVSEINNTPWGEKHLYLHDCSKQVIGGDSSEHQYTFEFDKKFHISPFMAMDMHYFWQFTLTAEKLFIKMSVDKDNVNLLNVVLDTNITQLVQNELGKLVIRKPFQPWKMSLGIYWQALKLWLKKVPVYDHPAKESINK